MHDDKTDRYERDGFVALGALAGPEWVGVLRAACERAVGKVRVAVGAEEQYSLTCVGDLSDDALAPLLSTAASAAAHLLEDDVEATFALWHASTLRGCEHRGWHQGLAYHHLPYSPSAVTVPLDELEILVALDDADTASTAAAFVPGFHVMPMLEHRRIEGPTANYELIDPARQLAMAEPVVTPLRAGEAVAYTLGTPHACALAAEAEPATERLSMRLGFRVVAL